MNCEYVRNYYGVPAEIGRRVIAYGKRGIIAEDRGQYIGVNLDEDSAGDVSNYHPTDGIVYEGIGHVRKPSKSKGKYAEFIRSEYSDSFADYLGIEKPKLDFGHWGDDRGKIRMISSRATGEFCFTQKAAKASYKVALAFKRKANP